MIKLISIILCLIVLSSAQAITCNVNSETTFTLFSSDIASGFYMEHMQTEMLNYNEIIDVERKPVQIPVLNVKATQFTFTGDKGAVVSYISLNRKIYQATFKLDGVVTKLSNCL